MEDLTGRQLGAYRIVGPLGEGGMAAVYRAVQTGKISRQVAIKVLPQHLAKSPEFVKRFDQEANVLAHLQHPRILPVFDFGESDGYTYLVMPFIESGTLADLLHDQPLPLPQIRSLGVQLAEALDYAHAQGLVHRDVKPSNVLVDERGNCLLSDFGISKLLAGAEKFTTTGGVVGTPAYMSPEQGRGETLDGRSDVYALGVIVYEMATGRVPFRAETPLAVIIKHMNDPLPLPRTLNPELPEALEQVLCKALAKAPGDRFATAGEFGRALLAAIPEPTTLMPAPGLAATWVGAAPTQVHPAPPPVAQAQPAGRRGPTLPLLIVGGLGLLGVAIVAVWLALTAPGRPAVPTPTAVAEAATDVVSTPASTSIAAAPTAAPTAAPSTTPEPSVTSAPTNTATAAATATSTPVTTDPIAGAWVGTLTSSDGAFSTRLELSIETGCLVGKVCGTYAVPAVPCSGSLTFNAVDQDTFVFVEQASSSSAACPSGGFEYLQARPDGSIAWRYLSGASQSTAVLRHP